MREKGRETGHRPAEAAAKARTRREAAARARRLAQSVIQDDDRAQLLDYAKTLEREAEDLERQIPDPVAKHKQEQSQQQAQQQPQQQAQQQQAQQQPPATLTNGKQGNGKKPKG